MYEAQAVSFTLTSVQISCLSLTYCLLDYPVEKYQHMHKDLKDLDRSERSETKMAALGRDKDWILAPVF